MLQDRDTAGQSLRDDGFDTMGGLLAKFEMPISKYRIPDDARTAVPADEAKIAEFNKRLDQLAAEPPFDGSFTVDVAVKDLPGSGDYMAGAKLARALAKFYSFIDEWKNVTVRLSVGRLNGETASPTQKDSVRREVTKVLGDSGASLYDGNGEKADVAVGYPVGGLDDVDVTVTQYGFDQFGSPEHDQYGSGPGFGSLGVLPVPARDREAAIAAAEEAKRPRENGEPPPNMMAALNDLKDRHDLAGFHFAYYSTFDRPVKPFVTEIVDSINSPESADPIGTNVGIAFSKPAKGLDSAAAAVREKPGWQVVRYSISRNEDTIETTPVSTPARSGAQGGGKKPSKKAEKRAKGKTGKGAPATATTGGEAASSAAAGVEHVLVLVEFPEGVHPNEMLSLYHSSLDPAGATGDQSFIEAYQMMAPDTDIRYDVTEHQRKLSRHIEELNTYDEHKRQGTTGRVMTKKKEADKRVTSVPVDSERKLVQKNLLHPMLLLINEKLRRNNETPKTD